MRSEKSYIGITIADIHFGALDSNQLLYELHEKFLKYIKSLKILDFIVICGDLFDSKLSLNSEHSKHLFAFFKSLKKICIQKNAKLRILKGTESHDNKQLEVLNYFSDNDIDMKIINNVSEEYLFPNMKVLYIPEEYMKDKDDFYKEFFTKNNEYDMIFAHGLINEVAFVAKNQQSEITMSKAPIFKSEDLLRICKGPIFFGHIHKAQTIKERIIYVGSFSRWIFGEEENKGFISIVYTPNTSNFNIEFIENDLAIKYNTIVISFDSKFYTNDDKYRLDFILSLVNNINENHLRIIFNIPEDYPNPLVLTNMINELFSKYKNIKIIINNNAKEIQKKKEMEEKIKTLLSTYGFIFDKGISTEDKISKYIQIKYNKSINIEDMRNYLYQKLNV